MSRIFGPIRQNGYVVKDLDAALDHWVNVMGAGPFFKIPHVAFAEFSYRGGTGAPDISIALGNAGDLQIELIQQHDDTPSQYRDFGEGLQHVAVWTEDYEADMARYAALGRGIVAEGRINAARFAYLDTDIHPGTMIEVMEFGPLTKAFMTSIREASIGWDGSDPVRTVNRG